MDVRINLPLDGDRRRGKGAEIVPVSPVSGGADWSWREATAAIGADIAEDRLDTRCAERALECTNACIEGVGREGSRAMLASGPQRQRGEHVAVVVIDVILAADIQFGEWHGWWVEKSAGARQQRRA